MAKSSKAKEPESDSVEAGEKAPQMEIIRANINRAVTKSGSFASLYANDVQVQVTPWDVRLILGEITGVPSPDEPTVTVTQVGELRMSPQLAKKLVMILFKQVQLYEKNVGPIPLPSDD